MSGIEALITALGLLFLLGLVFTPFVAFFIYVFYQNAKRKRIRERILAAQTGMIGNRRWFPVRYASAPRFKFNQRNLRRGSAVFFLNTAALSYCFLRFGLK